MMRIPFASAADVRLFYCRPCSTRDRATFRADLETPTQPCSFGCQRVEWKLVESYYCFGCKREGRTTIVYGPPPDLCELNHTHAWRLTAETEWLLLQWNRMKAAP